MLNEPLQRRARALRVRNAAFRPNEAMLARQSYARHGRDMQAPAEVLCTPEHELQALHSENRQANTGALVGAGLGVDVGNGVGKGVGEGVGEDVGERVGERVGEGVGATVKS